MGLFDEVNQILSGEEFDERPVDLETFVTSEDYLGLPPLSEEQYRLIEYSTQVYKRETLIHLYGEDEGRRRWRQTVNEVIAQLGKGSGKDYCSTISTARVVYLLLCLKDPAKYYGKPSGDSIDILNVAINAQQASNVFFKGFKRRVMECPWFAGKYKAGPGGEPSKADQINFKKNINCYSGHSEREGWEGYNLLIAILDEISGFAIESSSGMESAKTAQAIYDMYKASVSSRFPKFGKTILLSFPRFKGDFIQKRYTEVIAEKEVVVKSHTFKLDHELPDGIIENEFEVEWEEDRIVSYKEPKVYAIRRPTWIVNPTIEIDDLTADFWRNSTDALARFACMPPDAVDAFFKDKEAVERAFPHQPSPISPEGVFATWFKPQDRDYYIHVDLGYKHDRAAVAMSHCEEWVKVAIGSWVNEAPVVKLDCIRFWTPKADQNVDFNEVKNFILTLRSMGFRIKLVTFDQWNSIQIRNDLEAAGMDTDLLSVAKPHYEELALTIQENRLHGFHDEILLDELLGLKIMKGDKVDHPRKGSKDLADSVCGSVYNVVQYSEPVESRIIEARFLQPQAPVVEHKMIAPPRAPGPPPQQELADFLARMRIV